MVTLVPNELGEYIRWGDGNISEFAFNASNFTFSAFSPIFSQFLRKLLNNVWRYMVLKINLILK